MMTPDELGALGALRLRTRLNGEVVQDAAIDQMIFDIPTQIAYCSTFTRLEPGDVIEVEAENIGVLRNGVVDET
jgi:2-keto-4-pentenoate hydratase/2-oxohepta-3-ene-1,7-dioic acid hydratase in catechol pathway